MAVLVLRKSPLRFECEHCDSLCEADEEDFTPIHTVPPMWRVTCGYCKLENKVAPKALVAKLVGGL